ncbi:ferritin-like domain-containing protein [Meiothermus granaticius]|uniref:Uncharacterized protein n=1 Tax=Meiothermus granaticius NBRC 107808 TaxID=1227551 RepID=A0A399FBU9_9DEIN|nr:DUF2202 domain-containing protein [Meiothermus granaticius]RIH93633.1 hypothetical protein Mgrana_00457 [Meiothermus granaticius NBRC 107808]GEM86795.1 hypothetical protein MGR01S_14200 [Meiothermus granaticius NBRC 107808]
MTKKIMLGVLLIGALALGLAQPRFGSPSPITPTLTLSDQAKEALLEALTGPVGEYAAYATYDAVIQKYGALEPYVSIRASEAQHIQALQRQLEKYGVAYPTSNPYLGKITLPANLVTVAEQEVQTEVDNAAMYDKLLAAVQNYPDLTRVFENLKRASLVAHLNFFKAAAQQGGSLTPAQMQEAQLQVETQMRAQMNGRGLGAPNLQNAPVQGQMAQGQMGGMGPGCMGGNPVGGWQRGPNWR